MENRKNSKIEKKLITIKDKLVLLDSDVAMLYGVETRDINKAVSNNPNKFPDGYIIELSKNEFETLRCNFSTAIKTAFELLSQILEDTKNTDKNLIGFARWKYILHYSFLVSHY